MLDVDHLLTLAANMEPPDMPDRSGGEVGQPQTRRGGAWPDKPDMPDRMNKSMQEATNGEALHDEPGLVSDSQNTVSLYMSVMSGLSGEPMNTKGSSCPTDRVPMSGKSGTTIEEDLWTCPLGHRTYWVSDYGLKICSTCYPKPKRKTP